MSGSIRKVQSTVALPLTPQQNILTFDVSQDMGVIDMSSSYISLEIALKGLATPADYHNITLGQDGFQYGAGGSCLFRNCQIRQSGTANVLSEVNFCNIISENLNYVNQGHNKRKALSIYNGSGYVQANDAAIGGVVSIFNNEYSDSTAVLKVSLGDLFLGTLGNSDAVPSMGDLSMRFLLENIYKCFQRSVPTGVYSVGGEDFSGFVPSANVLANISVITATAPATFAGYAVGDTVYVFCQLNAVPTVLIRTVAAVDPAFLSITVNAPLDALVLATNVQPNKLSFDTRKTELNPINANTATLTFSPQSTYGVKVDIYSPTANINKGTVCNVKYRTINASGTIDQTVRTVLTTVLSKTTRGLNNQLLDTLTFDKTFDIPAGSASFDLHIEPLFTNMLTDYSISGAHLVIYRRVIPFANPKSMLLTQYKSQQISMQEGLGKFQYTFQVDNNAYNAYFLTPSETNMISVSHQKLGQYQYFLNNNALTTIPMPLDTSFHNDNLSRVFLNSETYKPVNIAPYRDTEIITNIRPICIPAKLFNRIDTKGDPNVQAEGMKALRVEVDALTGLTTPGINTYLVLECYTDVPV
jgi:hypothetical protein